MGYSTVTELPGQKASQEQLERLFQRYHFAYQFCAGKDVLEVACGGGQGLGYLAKAAKRVVGGDIDKDNLTFARKHYTCRNGIKLECFDAEQLPFQNSSFDVVLLYEAIYYLPEPEKFAKEAYRVLRENGTLIICSANKDWADFNPSPFSIRYFSVPELHTLLKTKFPEVTCYGGFSTALEGTKDVVISLMKRTAVNLHLMPKTMKSKELLKRLFFGKLRPLPYEIEDNMAEYVKPAPIASDLPNSSYKVIFAVARKKIEDYA